MKPTPRRAGKKRTQEVGVVYRRGKPVRIILTKRIGIIPREEWDCYLAMGTLSWTEPPARRKP